eukprot:813335-Prymnesium_polylepis.4
MEPTPKSKPSASPAARTPAACPPRAPRARIPARPWRSPRTTARHTRPREHIEHLVGGTAIAQFWCSEAHTARQSIHMPLPPLPTHVPLTCAWFPEAVPIQKLYIARNPSLTAHRWRKNVFGAEVKMSTRSASSSTERR